MEVLLQFARELWTVTTQMAPYLLFGFLFAGILSVLVSQRLVERNLGGRGLWPSVKAALFGVPLPLCSCGVIPVSASLRNQGASRSATTSFLLSTPQTGVDSIMVTYSLLGPVFAVFRPIAAFITGLIGGGLVEIFDKDDDEVSEHLKEHREEKENSLSLPQKILTGLHYGFVTLPQDIAKALIVGLIIAALMSLVIPDDFFSGLLGVGIWSMLAMMLAGIPIYVCATASVPIAAAFMAKGISAGAALVFLMTGPATNAATITTIWKVLGRRTAIIYLATVAGSALLGGFLLNYIFTIETLPAPIHVHDMTPSLLDNLSAVVLFIVLAYALYKLYSRRLETISPELDVGKKVLNIKGMTCSHCAINVKRALEEVEGVKSASVNLKTGRAVVTGEGYDGETLKEAVSKIGYKVVD